MPILSNRIQNDKVIVRDEDAFLNPFDMVNNKDNDMEDD